MSGLQPDGTLHGDGSAAPGRLRATRYACAVRRSAWLQHSRHTPGAGCAGRVACAWWRRNAMWIRSRRSFCRGGAAAGGGALYGSRYTTIRFGPISDLYLSLYINTVSNDTVSISNTIKCTQHTPPRAHCSLVTAADRPGRAQGARGAAERRAAAARSQAEPSREATSEILKLLYSIGILLLITVLALQSTE